MPKKFFLVIAALLAAAASASAGANAFQLQNGSIVDCTGVQTYNDCISHQHCTMCGIQSQGLQFCRSNDGRYGACPATCEELHHYPGQCGEARLASAQSGGPCALCPSTQLCVTKGSTCQPCHKLSKTQCGQAQACGYCEDLEVCLDIGEAINCPTACSYFDGSTVPGLCSAAGKCTKCSSSGICVPKSISLSACLSCAATPSILTQNGSGSSSFATLPKNILCDVATSSKCTYCNTKTSLGVCVSFAAGGGECPEPESCSSLDASTCRFAASCRACDKMGVCIAAMTGSCPSKCSELSTSQCLQATGKCQQCESGSGCCDYVPTGPPTSPVPGPNNQGGGGGSSSSGGGGSNAGAIAGGVIGGLVVVAIIGVVLWKKRQASSGSSTSGYLQV